MGYNIIPFNFPLGTYLALPPKGQAHAEHIITLRLESLLEVFFRQRLKPVHNIPLLPTEAFNLNAERSLHNICASAIILCCYCDIKQGAEAVTEGLPIILQGVPEAIIT